MDNVLSSNVQTHGGIARRHFVSALVGVLFSGSMECILEAMRSLGNFTKSRAIRRMLIKKKGTFRLLITEYF